jgi:PPOX class probable F420-dependent enzyme
MPTSTGDLSVLTDPVAQRLLTSRAPARLAYTGLDNSPRAIPIWFHWDGRQLLLGTQPWAAKVKALRANPAVALTIDSNEFPYEVLLIRGTAEIEAVEDVSPEYAAAAERYFGPESGAAWVAQLRGKPMACIRVTPGWAKVLDFQTRFPSAFSA